MEKPAIPFAQLVSIGYVRRITKKRLFGGEYVEYGQFVASVGSFLHSTGAILGRAFTNRPNVLGKLLMQPGADPLNYLTVGREILQERLGTTDVETALESMRASGENYFTDSFMRTEWAKLKVPYPPSSRADMEKLKRASETKIEPDLAMQKAFSYMIEGIVLGVDWPEFVEWSWNSTFAKGTSAAETSKLLKNSNSGLFSGSARHETRLRLAPGRAISAAC